MRRPHIPSTESPDCDSPGGQESCQLNEPCEPCKQEILERGIESAQLQAELEAELEAEPSKH